MKIIENIYWKAKLVTAQTIFPIPKLFEIFFHFFSSNYLLHIFVLWYYLLVLDMQVHYDEVSGVIMLIYQFKAVRFHYNIFIVSWKLSVNKLLSVHTHMMY